MRILVTGGAGYIGSHVAHLANKKGYELVIVDDLSTGHKRATPPNAVFVEGNVGDRELMEKVFRNERPEAVMHFAAHIEVEESVHNPLKYYQNNTVNTLKLLETCIKHQVHRFIFSSTAAVYGTPQSLPVDETSLVAPINPYGHSKAMSEQILKDLASSESAFRYVALRYFNVAGASGNGHIGQSYPNATHLIKVTAEVATGQRQSLKVFGTDYDTVDGTCVRDYIHVDDIAQAHLDALDYLKNGGASDVFNCGYGHGTSVKEVIQAFENSTGVKIPFENAPRRAGDSEALYSNNEKIKTVLGWRPQFDDLNYICKTAFDWESKNR
ncbi:MAG: UDP-glucose 4-epimerase GalE [Bdellovibrionales bacterium]|nr:UDP-glucose 4-epimerase GalE [Bdellovibrionales bacterium]